MAEEPPQQNNLKNDYPAEWPEEVKQAYHSLKIPSLYDALLANEKLSLEIRKQERTIKTMSESIQTLVSQITTLVALVQEEWEEYEEEERENNSEKIERLNEKRQNFESLTQGDLTDLEVELLSDKQSYLEDQSQYLMMEAYDILLHHSQQVKQLTTQLIYTLPKKQGIFSKQPLWLSAALEINHSLVTEVEQARYRLLSRLEEMTIQTIEPKVGDLFDPAFHLALEKVSGGQEGTIKQVVHIGYRQQVQVLRLAEVIVYH